jgi:hypothetical protein
VHAAAVAQAYNACQSQPDQCEIPPGRFELCRWPGACLCFEDGCSANLNRTHRFDLQVTGNLMEGLISVSMDNEFPAGRSASAARGVSRRANRARGAAALCGSGP